MADSIRRRGDAGGFEGAANDGDGMNMGSGAHRPAQSIAGSEEKRRRFLASLEACTNLPSPPALATRFVELGQQPNATINEVAQLIGLDPATSAKIMRLANSALYARQRKIENLRQAINLFGLEGALSMALSLTVVTGLRASRGRQGRGFDYEHYWRRSIASATACQVIGHAMSVGRREELFLAGLLQDLGMLVIDAWSAEFYDGLSGSPAGHGATTDFEHASLGMDHAEIGAHVLRGWSFPEVLASAIAGSHEPLEGTINQEFVTMAKVLHIASEMADLIVDGHERDEGFLCLEAKALELLDMRSEQLTEIFTSVVNEVGPLSQIFGVDLGDDFVARTITDRAREVLLVRNLHAIQEATVLKQVNVNLQRKARTLEEENRRDPLTCLYNRAHHDKVVQEEFASAVENHWPLSLCFIDLDHFKVVNDNHGHQVGDLVLQKAAELLVQATRGSDVVARYGGEEFVVIMPGTAEDGVRIVCNRILESFRKTEFQGQDGETPIHVTASIGIATYSDSSEFKTAEDLVRAADKAVYAAKLGGRDRMVFYETRYND